MDKVYRFHKDDKVVFLNKKAMRTFVKISKKQKQMSIITGSILSVFAVMAIFNDKIAYQSKMIAMKEAQNQSRNIASVKSISNQAYHNGFQEKLLNDLKKEIKEDSTVFAKKPNKQDAFLKGQMLGNYQLKKDGSERILLTHDVGEKLRLANMNSLVLSFLGAFYQGEFKEIKKVSQADTSVNFKILSQEGKEQSLIIQYNNNKEIQSIELK